LGLDEWDGDGKPIGLFARAVSSLLEIYAAYFGCMNFYLILCYFSYYSLYLIGYLSGAEITSFVCNKIARMDDSKVDYFFNKTNQ